MSSLYQCGFDCGRVIAICTGSRRDQSRATAEMAIARVAERVKQGGHDIPEVVIRRRFATGWKNFAHYREQVHSWVLYDNSGGEPIMIEWGEQA